MSWPAAAGKRLRESERRQQDVELREFVYLDEVSVYSFMASRSGAIAKDFTETMSRSLEAEVTASSGVSWGVGKGSASVRGKAGQTTGTQVVRKSIIQSSFKDFYESEKARFVAPRPKSDPPVHPTHEAFEAAVMDGSLAPWVVRPTLLTRGSLVEMEVELDAEAVYRATAAIASLLDLADGNEGLFGNAATVAEMAKVSRVLDKLQGGLVPLRGRSLTHEWIVVGGLERLVHRDLLAVLPSDWGVKGKPVFVVGVAETALFWKDLRRILFSASRYVVLCRLNGEGLQTSWTPVKLAHVLKQFDPTIDEQLNGGAFLAALTQPASQTAESEPYHRGLMRTALLDYGRRLAEQHGKTWTGADADLIGLPTESQCDRYVDVESRTSAFRELTGALRSRLELPEEPTPEAELRTDALARVGLTSAGQWPDSPAASGTTSPVPTDSRYVDSEIVAIYW